MGDLEPDTLDEMAGDRGPPRCRADERSGATRRRGGRPLRSLSRAPDLLRLRDAPIGSAGRLGAFGAPDDRRDRRAGSPARVDPRLQCPIAIRAAATLRRTRPLALGDRRRGGLHAIGTVCRSGACRVDPAAFRPGRRLCQQCRRLRGLLPLGRPSAHARRLRAGTGSAEGVRARLRGRLARHHGPPRDRGAALPDAVRRRVGGGRAADDAGFRRPGPARRHRGPVHHAGQRGHRVPRCRRFGWPREARGV